MSRISVLITLLLLPSAFVLSQWYVKYEEGRNAAMERGGDLRRAVALLNEAMDDESDSKANKRTTSLQFIDYFPYLYRGIAYYKLGELDKARADLNKEKDDGAVNDAERDRGAPALLAQYLDLLQKPAPQTVQQKPPAVAEQKPPPVVQQKPSGNSPVNVQPDRKKPDVIPSGKSNENAGRSVASTARPKGNLPAPREPSKESTVPSADTAGSALFREAVALFNAGKIIQAKSAFLRVRAAAPANQEIGPYLGTIASFEQKTHTGISAFFRGEYAEAIDNLSATSKNGNDNPHVYAFIACSYAAQYLLAGGEDRNLKKEAVEAFSRVKGIDPRYELDSQLISPGIIALLKGE